MEIFSSASIFGLVLFVAGILILNSCNSAERKNFNAMQKRRTLKLFGRRKRDAEVSILYDYKGSLMTFGGAALSLMGLLQFFTSITM